MTQDNVERVQGKDTLWSLFFIGFGLYLLAGAYMAATNGKWPVFLPTQVDFVGLLAGVLGNPLAGYIGAFFLTLLGGFFIWLGVTAFRGDERAIESK